MDLRPDELLPTQTRLLRELTSQLTGGAVVALVGPFGMGKTSVARVLAHELRRSWGNEHGVLELSGTNSSAPGKAAAWLDVHLELPGPRLLIIDNADPLLGDPRVAEAWKVMLRRALDTGRCSVLLLAGAWSDMGYPTGLTRAKVERVPQLSREELCVFARRFASRCSSELVTSVVALGAPNLRVVRLLAKTASDHAAQFAARGGRERDLEASLLALVQTNRLPALLGALPALREDAQSTWELLRKHGVVQLSREPGRGLANAIAYLAKEEGYECVATALVHHAREVERGKLLEELLGEPFASIDPAAARMAGGSAPGGETAQWQVVDRIGTALEARNVATQRRLFIIEAPHVLPRVGTVGSLSDAELAELLDVVERQHTSDGLRILLLSDDRHLAGHLRTHMSRPRDDAFRFPALSLRTTHVETVPDAKRAALRHLCGRRVDLLVAVEAYADGGRDWASALRELRVACLVDHVFADEISSIVGGLPTQARRLAERLEGVPRALELRSRLVDLAGSRDSAGGDAYAAQLQVDRTATLFGDDAVNQVDRLESRGLVEAWLRHVAFEFRSWKKTGRKMGTNPSAVVPSVIKPRLVSLCSEFDAAMSSWTELACRLDFEEQLDKYCEVSGLSAGTDAEQVARFLFAVEPRTPDEVARAWFGKPALQRKKKPRRRRSYEGVLCYEIDPSSKRLQVHENKSSWPSSQVLPTVPDAMECEALRSPALHHVDEARDRLTLDVEVARSILDLLGPRDAGLLLRKQFPSSKGTLEHRLQEWVMQSKWSERIAAPLGSFLGFPRLLDCADTLGLAGALEYSSNSDLAKAILEAWGVPKLPRPSGIKASLSELMAWVDGPAENEPDLVLQGRVSQLYRAVETACMTSIVVYGEVIPSYASRIAEHLPPPRGTDLRKPWQARVFGLSLGKLNGAVRSLLNRIQPGGAWAEEWQDKTYLDPPPAIELFESLERLRELRPPWMHGGPAALETGAALASRAREVKAEFVGAVDLGMIELVPSLVQVVAEIRDVWGHHAEVVDESGVSALAYHTTLGDSPIGSQFFMVAPTNPAPLRPVLVPRKWALQEEAR